MSVTRWNGSRDVAVAPFDIETTGSDRRLADLTRALVLTRGWWTDAYALGGAPVGRNTVAFRVWIPEGAEGRVAKDARVEGIRVPPCIALNDGKDRRCVCNACGVSFNARVGEDERGGDGSRSVIEASSRPVTCSPFCAGRLVGRADAAVTT